MLVDALVRRNCQPGGHCRCRWRCGLALPVRWSVIAVGSPDDGEAKSGLGNGDAASHADGQTTERGRRPARQLGGGERNAQRARCQARTRWRLAVTWTTARPTFRWNNTQAFIGAGAKVKAGEDVGVAMSDKTIAIAAGAGAGGGAAGVAGSFGVVLLHDLGRSLHRRWRAGQCAKQHTDVTATTSENVFNVGITGSGAGAADVSASFVVNVVSPIRGSSARC